MRAKTGSSLPGVLSGLTLLIFAGIGMSTLMQRRFRSSDGNHEIREQIEARKSEIGTLQAVRNRLENQFDGEGRGTLQRARELHETETALRENNARLTELRRIAANLRGECDTLAGSFDQYRAAYRSHLWQTAAGEKIGVLNLANGRQFTGVSIARVTEGAMEIVHDAGRARIPAKDLAPQWSVRFQGEK